MAVSVQLLAVSLLLAGCSLQTSPQSDPTRFYVLSTTATTVTPDPTAKGPAVHLRPVELASYIKAKPMIVRRSSRARPR